MSNTKHVCHIAKLVALDTLKRVFQTKNIIPPDHYQKDYTYYNIDTGEKIKVLPATKRRDGYYRFLINANKVPDYFMLIPLSHMGAYRHGPLSPVEEYIIPGSIINGRKDIKIDPGLMLFSEYSIESHGFKNMMQRRYTKMRWCNSD